uniref:ATP-dependent Clp protease proteolytic subunit n=1 Tax=Silene abyssinica TaxID=39925 RepID=B0LP85_9CARY|nr:ATP-dependent protease proteolytic subunit [Silene abyssinica]
MPIGVPKVYILNPLPLPYYYSDSNDSVYDRDGNVVDHYVDEDGNVLVVDEDGNILIVDVVDYDTGDDDVVDYDDNVDYDTGDDDNDTGDDDNVDYDDENTGDFCKDLHKRDKISIPNGGGFDIKKSKIKDIPYSDNLFNDNEIPYSDNFSYKHNTTYDTLVPIRPKRDGDNGGVGAENPIPIGTKLPDKTKDEWMDLYECLYEERYLFLGDEIKIELANKVSALMLYLSIQDPNKDMRLFINSPGGGLISGIVLFDMMQFVRADVCTICYGLAASTASLVLLGGELTKRSAFANARVMIHQPASAFFKDKSRLFAIDSRELLKLREQVTQIYIQRTKKPEWLIWEDMERDTFMSPEEALDHGIVDYITYEWY